MPDKNEALNHAWKWFEYHAKQRLTMIRFYILVIGALGAGIGYLYENDFYEFSALISVFGIVSSFSFIRLDQRISDLIKIGEDALETEQSKLASETGFETIKMCMSANDKNKRGCYPYSYKQIIRLLLCSAVILFILSLWFSIVEMQT